MCGVRNEGQLIMIMLYLTEIIVCVGETSRHRAEHHRIRLAGDGGLYERGAVVQEGPLQSCEHCLLVCLVVVVCCFWVRIHLGEALLQIAKRYVLSRLFK